MQCQICIFYLVSFRDVLGIILPCAVVAAQHVHFLGDSFGFLSVGSTRQHGNPHRWPWEERPGAHEPGWHGGAGLRKVTAGSLVVLIEARTLSASGGCQIPNVTEAGLHEVNTEYASRCDVNASWVELKHNVDLFLVPHLVYLVEIKCKLIFFNAFKTDFQHLKPSTSQWNGFFATSSSSSKGFSTHTVPLLGSCVPVKSSLSATKQNTPWRLLTSCCSSTVPPVAKH